MELKIFLLYSSVLSVLLGFYFKATWNCCSPTCANCCIDNAGHCYLLCNMLRLKFNKTQCSGTASLMHLVLNLFLHFKGVMSRRFCFLAKNGTKYLTNYLWLLHKRLLRTKRKISIESFKKEQVNRIYKWFLQDIKSNQFFYFKWQSRPSAVKDLWLVIVSLLTKLKHCFQISFTNLMFIFGIFKVILKRWHICPKD